MKRIILLLAFFCIIYTGNSQVLAPKGITVGTGGTKVTLSVSELKNVSGILAPIQQQLNGKIDTAKISDISVFLGGNQAITGTWTAPTAAQGTNTTQLATTAGVLTEISANNTNNLDLLQHMVGYRMGKVFPIGMDLSLAIANLVTMTSGRKYFCSFYLKKPTLITGYKFNVQIAGVYTADAENGLSIHSMASNLSTEVTGTKVTSPTMWSVAGVITVPLTTPITLPAGEYKVYALYHSSAQTTAPIITGLTVGDSAGTYNNNAFSGNNAIIGYVNTQTILTTTQNGGFIIISQVPLIQLY